MVYDSSCDYSYDTLGMLPGYLCGGIGDWVRQVSEFVFENLCISINSSRGQYIPVNQ